MTRQLYRYVACPALIVAAAGFAMVGGCMATGEVEGRVGQVSSAVLATDTQLNILYVHGVQGSDSGRTNAQNSLIDLESAVNAALPARIATYSTLHPTVHLVTASARANLYTATTSPYIPSGSTPLHMDDWSIGSSGCSPTSTAQGQTCTTAYEWRSRLANEIKVRFPGTARNIVLVGHSTGARTAFEVAANVGATNLVGSYDWGVQSRIAAVVSVHGMLDALNSSSYNVVGLSSFNTTCKAGGLVGLSSGNGWCEYAGSVSSLPAADWVSQNMRSMSLTSWASCSNNIWTGWSDGDLPYAAQGSPLQAGIDMTPCSGSTYCPAHGQKYGSFCHSDITNSSSGNHTAAVNAAQDKLLTFLFDDSARVGATGNPTTAQVAYNQSSATYTVGSTCPSGQSNEGSFDVAGNDNGSNQPTAPADIFETNGSTCNGSFYWKQTYDPNNTHSATFWWKAKSRPSTGGAAWLWPTGNGPSPSAPTLTYNTISTGYSYSLDVEEKNTSTQALTWTAPCVNTALFGSMGTYAYNNQCVGSGQSPYALRVCTAFNLDWAHAACGVTNYDGVSSSVNVTIPAVAVSWNDKGSGWGYSMDVEKGSTWIGPCVDNGTIGSSLGYNYGGWCTHSPASVPLASISSFRVCAALNGNWAQASCGVTAYNGSASSVSVAIP